MLGEKGIPFNDHRPESLALRALDDNSGSLKGLAPNLNADSRVGYQIAIPVRVSWRASIRGDHQQAVAIGDIHHRRRARLAAFGARCGEQEQGAARKLLAAAASLPVGAELFD